MGGKYNSGRLREKIAHRMVQNTMASQFKRGKNVQDNKGIKGVKEHIRQTPLSIA